jgi:hypothetical protein
MIWKYREEDYTTHGENRNELVVKEIKKWLLIMLR